LLVVAAIPFQNDNFSVEGLPTFLQYFTNNVHLVVRHSRTFNDDLFHCQLGNLGGSFPAFTILVRKEEGL
jgi:hypothetical protein